MEATIETTEQGCPEEVFEPLWNDEKAGEYLGVRPTTLWRLRHKGLPYLRVGSEIRYIPASVQAWVKAQEVSQIDTKQE